MVFYTPPGVGQFEIDARIASDEIRRLREENARLIRERDEARAEEKKYHDALVARHGGEPVALLEELDASRAEVLRLEGLILDWSDFYSLPTNEDCPNSMRDAVYVLDSEARRIRAQREEGR